MFKIYKDLFALKSTYLIFAIYLIVFANVFIPSDVILEFLLEEKKNNIKILLYYKINKIK